MITFTENENDELVINTTGVSALNYTPNRNIEHSYAFYNGFVKNTDPNNTDTYSVHFKISKNNKNEEFYLWLIVSYCDKQNTEIIFQNARVSHPVSLAEHPDMYNHIKHAMERIYSDGEWNKHVATDFTLVIQNNKAVSLVFTKV
jgi:hypothetical protein